MRLLKTVQHLSEVMPKLFAPFRTLVCAGSFETYVGDLSLSAHSSCDRVAT